MIIVKAIARDIGMMLEKTDTYLPAGIIVEKLRKRWPERLVVNVMRFLAAENVIYGVRIHGTDYIAPMKGYGGGLPQGTTPMLDETGEITLTVK